MIADRPLSGRCGEGELSVRRVAGQSTITGARAVNPLKLLTPRSRGVSVWACFSSFGGGLVAGDETRVTLRLGPAAACYLGTQASTKVYRNPDNLPCAHRLHAHLETDSLLVIAPDPVQCFAGSAYVQEQRFDLAPDANLVLVDSLVSGRVARGERWAFTRFQSRNEVVVGGQPVFLDALLLDDHLGAGSQSRNMGRFNAIATVFLTGPKLAVATSTLLADVDALPLTKRAELLIAASPVGEGAVVRIAGADIETVQREVRRRLTFVSDLLGDNPWARKW